MKTRHPILISAAGALLAASLGAATTSSTPMTHHEKAEAHGAMHVNTTLAKEAKVPLATARASALARVPGSTVRSEQIERENGRLVWSFDLATAGRPGVVDVKVDANSGNVLSLQHEGAKKERHETRTTATPHHKRALHRAHRLHKRTHRR